MIVKQNVVHGEVIFASVLQRIINLSYKLYQSVIQELLHVIIWPIGELVELIS